MSSEIVDGSRAGVTAAHTCDRGGRSNCSPCMRFEVELWNAINCYAISVGGNPARYVHGNIPRMPAVAAVGAVISELVGGRVAAAARALPTNPDCTDTVGKNFVSCGEEGYYCSDRCWTIGRLRASRAQVAEYERQLGIRAADSGGRPEEGPRIADPGRGLPDE